MQHRADRYAAPTELEILYTLDTTNIPSLRD
jgi:hypothetical protein